jgi:EF hand
MSLPARGFALAIPFFVVCVALAADPLEAEQFEEKCVLRAAERAARTNKTDRAKWMHELEAAFPGKVANALTEDEYATWFDLLANKAGEWRRDESPTPEIGALFDRVVARLELGPVPALTRDEFKKFAKRVLREGNPPSEVQDPNDDADRAFRVLDRDASGELEAEEYTPPLKADKLRTDADSNGRVSKDEYRAYFKRTVATKADALAAKNGDAARGDAKGAKGKGGPALPTWFAALDADGDNQVSLFEWRKGGKPVATFNEMDLNADGLLTRDEYARYARMLDETLKQKKREKDAEEREK